MPRATWNSSWLSAFRSIKNPRSACIRAITSSSSKVELNVCDTRYSTASRSGVERPMNASRESSVFHRLSESRVPGADDCLCPVRYPQLVENVRDMIAHSLGTKDQFAGNFDIV